MVEVHDPGAHRPGGELPGGEGLPVHDADQHPGTDGSSFVCGLPHSQVASAFSLVT